MNDNQGHVTTLLHTAKIAETKKLKDLKKQPVFNGYELQRFESTDLFDTSPAFDMKA